jgi:hypothetical protein
MFNRENQKLLDMASPGNIYGLDYIQLMKAGSWAEQQPHSLASTDAQALGLWEELESQLVERD